MIQRYPLFEGFGYFISIIGVALLGMAAWLSADGRPILRFAVVTGATLSVLGMILRRHGGRKHHK